MKKMIQHKLLLTLSILLIGTIAWSQQINTPAPSPGSKVTQMVGLTEVIIEYSRPSMKDRKIFGELVEYGKVWRVGANQATKFTFSDDVKIGDGNLAAGSYAVLAWPDMESWKINFYTYESGNFGSYVEKDPAVSLQVTPTQIDCSVESFLINIDNLRNSSATIDILWETTYVSIPLEVNTDAAVMAQIDDFDVSANRSLANGYYQASSYLYGAKKKMEMALDYATKAVELRPDTYWMHRNRALILAELGNYKEAVKAAEESTKYAVEMGNENYPKMNAASIAEWKKKK